MCLNDNDSLEIIIQPATTAVSGEVAAVWLRTRGVVTVQNAPFRDGVLKRDRRPINLELSPTPEYTFTPPNTVKPSRK
jgi:hypothetical protein